MHDWEKLCTEYTTLFGEIIGVGGVYVYELQDGQVRMESKTRKEEDAAIVSS